MAASRAHTAFLAGLKLVGAAGRRLRIAHRLVLTAMLMHGVVMAASGAVLVVRRRGSLLCRSAAAEKHGRGREPLERDRYQQQASHEQAETDHCGNSNDNWQSGEDYEPCHSGKVKRNPVSPRK